MHLPLGDTPGIFLRWSGKYVQLSTSSQTSPQLLCKDPLLTNLTLEITIHFILNITSTQAAFSSPECGDFTLQHNITPKQQTNQRYADSGYDEDFNGDNRAATATGTARNSALG